MGEQAIVREMPLTRFRAARILSCNSRFVEEKWPRHRAMMNQGFRS